MSLQQLINENYDRLTDNDLYFLDFLMADMEVLNSANLSEIANLSNISTTSIIRLTQKLGFEGFSQFKYYIISELETIKEFKTKPDYHYMNSIILDDITETIKLFEQNNQLDSIYNFIVNSKNIYIYGTGYAQNIMIEEFNRCLINNNIYPVVIPTLTELAAMYENMNKNDLFIVVALSGNINDELKNIIYNLKIRKIKVISITLLNGNLLAKISDYRMYYQVSTLNTAKQLNTSSYVTLNLALALLYEGLTNYIIKNNNQ